MGFLKMKNRVILFLISIMLIASLIIVFPVQTTRISRDILYVGGSNTFWIVSIGAYTILEHAVQFNCSTTTFLSYSSNTPRICFEKVAIKGVGATCAINGFRGINLTECTFKGRTCSWGAENVTGVKNAIDVSGNANGQVRTAIYSGSAIKLGSGSSSVCFISRTIANTYFTHAGTGQNNFCHWLDPWFTRVITNIFVYDNKWDGFKRCFGFADAFVQPLQLILQELEAPAPQTPPRTMEERR